MKRLWFYVIMISLAGCKEDDISNVELREFRLIQGSSLRYHIGNFPTEGGITITKQAKEYTVSRIVVDTTLGGATYEYTPAAGFKGQDSAEITRTDSDGSKKISEQTTRIVISVE
jgi:hypothetical protein